MTAEPSARESGGGGDAPLDALNEPQARAVAHGSGPLIVFAGAGSGKTRVITYRIANLVAAHNVFPYAILAVTFTNKAAGEMRERLRRILGPDITRQLWLGTFHSVCVRLLRRYHEATGLSPHFVIYDDSDQKAVMKRVIKDLGLDERRFPPAQILGRIQREKQEARGPDQMSVDNYFDEIAIRCFRLYEERMRAANACDFSDLLLHVLRLAEDDRSEAAAHLSRRFRHVLVDEFQDTNHVQYRLVRALSSQHRNLCVVGDDDQSIYRWRGADIRNIRDFKRDYPDATLIKLEQNYRSTKRIVGAALGVIRRASERQPKELWTGNPSGEPVRVVHCATERDEAAYVVEGVQQSIAAGVSPRDMAVFYRTHAQSRVLEEAMRSESIPYQIIGGTKFFDRAEVKDLLAYLRTVVNPASDVDLLRVINKPPRKIGKKTITTLVDTAQREGSSVYAAIVPVCAGDKLPAAARRSLRAFDELMQGFMRSAQTASPRELCEEVLEATGYAEWLEKQDSAEADARIDNLRELLGSIDEYEADRAMAEEPPTLADYLTRVSLLSDADSIEEVPRVPMMTIHAAKGLEFDAVWLTGMEEDLFPLSRREETDPEELEEERRLAYVAITRARQRLFISHASTRMLYGQMRYNTPSRFLRDLPPETQERVATNQLGELSRDYTLGRRERLTTREWFDARRPAHPRSAPASSERSPDASVGGAQSEALERLERQIREREQGERHVERAEVEMFDAGELDDEPFVDRSETHDFGEYLGVGSKVRHQKFGVGQVTAVRGGSNPTVSVKFPGWPVKQIKLTFLSPA